jgi:hypothetical protein
MGTRAYGCTKEADKEGKVYIVMMEFTNRQITVDMDTITDMYKQWKNQSFSLASPSPALCLY